MGSRKAPSGDAPLGDLGPEGVRNGLRNGQDDVDRLDLAGPVHGFEPGKSGIEDVSVAEGPGFLASGHPHIGLGREVVADGSACNPTQVGKGDRVASSLHGRAPVADTGVPAIPFTSRTS